MTRVKICGLTREADRDAAIAAGADALGFTVDVPVDTPREISAERAVELVADVPPFVTAVLVTMPDSVDRALELVETVEPDAVQIHSSLSPDALATLSERVEVPVLAAVGAADDDVAEYAAVADALVVDSVDEQGAGGTGETHDWERTAELVGDLDVPIVLAGGLTPENVTAAVAAVEPFAVDVASGVEAAGGETDHDAVGNFIDGAQVPQVHP
jgi:phosphoribosylanthranilate isomerase